MASFEVTTSAADVSRDLKRFGVEVTDWRPALRDWFLWFKRTALPAWGKIKATGGSYFGKPWARFKPQYTRADGTVVEAWGGNPKVRGRGNVKGRKRPSGQPVKPTSVQFQDTASRGLRGSLFSKPTRLTKTEVEISSNLPQAESAVKLKRNPLDLPRSVLEKKLFGFGEKHVDRILRKRGFK